MKEYRLALVYALIAAAIPLQACTNTYKLENLPISGTPAGPSQPLLKAGDNVTVVRPRDGQYGDKVYQGSGAMVQLAVIGCLKQRGVEATAIDPSGSAVATDHHGWSIKPMIMEWEDRATEWSGLPDRIKIELQTIAPDGKLRDSTIVSGSSKWATFGGDHPQDMLTPAITPWATLLVK